VSDRFSRIDGAEVELVKSSGGVFEITLDGELVHSKKASGRFPTPEEVESIAGRPGTRHSAPHPAPDAPGGRSSANQGRKRGFEEPCGCRSGCCDSPWNRRSNRMAPG